MGNIMDKEQWSIRMVLNGEENGKVASPIMEKEHMSYPLVKDMRDNGKTGKEWKRINNPDERRPV